MSNNTIQITPKFKLFVFKITIKKSNKQRLILKGTRRFEELRRLAMLFQNCLILALLGYFKGFRTTNTHVIVQNSFSIFHMLILLQETIFLALPPFPLLGKRHGHVPAFSLVTQIAQFLTRVLMSARALRSFLARRGRRDFEEWFRFLQERGINAACTGEILA